MHTCERYIFFEVLGIYVCFVFLDYALSSSTQVQSDLRRVGPEFGIESWVCNVEVP